MFTFNPQFFKMAFNKTQETWWYPSPLSNPSSSGNIWRFPFKTWFSQRFCFLLNPTISHLKSKHLLWLLAETFSSGSRNAKCLLSRLVSPAILHLHSARQSLDYCILDATSQFNIQFKHPVGNASLTKPTRFLYVAEDLFVKDFTVF